MKLCDLHVHSVYSDGTRTPREIIEEAKRLGLGAVALCDHNTVDGLGEFLEAAKKTSVEAVAGIEFSVDYLGTELHLLALDVPESSFERISRVLAEVVERKMQSNEETVRSLNRAGYAVDFNELKSKTPNGFFNRAHIAAELMRLGYVSSVSEAFDTLLAKGGAHYREPKRLTVWEALDLICEIGAIPVLAHPFLNLNETKLLEFLPQAKARGLVGMECFYSLYDEETSKKAIEIADKFSLKYSGGSDYHGANKPDIMLGTGKGTLRIPYALLTKLRSAKAE